MANYQCMRCGNIWNCEAQLRRIDAACTPEGKLQTSRWQCAALSATSPARNCGRACAAGTGSTTALRASPTRLLAWLEDAIETKSNVAVLEVGVGPNTPVVEDSGRSVCVRPRRSGWEVQLRSSKPGLAGASAAESARGP